MGTTLPKDSDIDITPTIPKLYEVGKTDTSIEVEWEKAANKIVYELAVDENIIEDPSKAKMIINSQNIKDNAVAYNKENGKEFLVDENIIEDPSKAKMIINSQNIKDNAVAYNKENGKEFLKYNIKPLFPDTGYYIWIRAIVEDTEKSSDWSTPIYVRTNTISKPEPPSGFGLASEKSLSTYNTNNNTDYKPITDKYLALEWLRDPEDLLKDPKAEKKGTAEPLLDPNIKKTYMVKFNELMANRYYYTRAKTKVYISKGSDGTIEKVYTYIIQLSPNQDFKDAVEIEMPTVDPKGDKVLTSESDWTTTYRYRTKFSTDGDGDYDGNIIDDLYPLPTEDFEILYDPITKTLTYRFRSNKTDVNGNADNLVDQRFITKLINNKVYDYNLDLTKHNNYTIQNRRVEIPYSVNGNADNLVDQRFITKLINNKVYDYNLDLTKHNNYTIQNRRVEIPYSIISAFDERKISLSITTGGTRFKLNPAFLNTSEAKSVGKLGTNTMVAIDIMQNPDGLPILNHNQIYGTTPEYIKISINNNGVYTPLTFTGSDMDIMLKLKNRSLTLDSSVGAYRNINNNIWERIPSSYSSETGIHTVKTNKLGKYTTISNGVNQSNINGNNDVSLVTNVNSKIVFTDLNNLNMKNPISVVQFNNIIAGVANGKKEIAINGGLSDKDYKGLQNSGMLLQGSVVGREAGINSLVKLYEMKTKTKFEPISDINTMLLQGSVVGREAGINSLVKLYEMKTMTKFEPISDINTTPYKDIKNANKAYQNNLIKAGDIGFYKDSTKSSPKNVMTIEEMFYMIDIILADSGY